MSNLLYLPTLKKSIVRPWFLPDKEFLDEQKKLLSSIFFLVKQGDTFGERLRCGRCDNRHDYITLNCIERPFAGTIKGLWAYYNLIKNNGLLKYMTEEERSRYDAIQDTLGSLPDLSEQHPLTARNLVKDIGPDSMKIGALSLGVLEGISRIDAVELVKKINMRGLKPKLVLEGLSQYDKYRKVV